MSHTIWKKCLLNLKNNLTSKEFSMWIRPLQINFHKKNILQIYAPNQLVHNWVKNKYLNYLNKILSQLYEKHPPLIILKVKKILKKTNCLEKKIYNVNKNFKKIFININNNNLNSICLFHSSNINKKHTFNNFITGKSNQLAKIAAFHVANNLGHTYNPLFIYGKTGLGKTHLLNAITNYVLNKSENVKIICIHSENFIQKMVHAIKNNTIDQFKIYYRSLDVLLIDDIHFFANKKHSQEELFHTVNTLLQKNQQIILTSDRCPIKIGGVTDRLKSRFGWGLTIAIEPPTIDTRIAILIQQAKKYNIPLSYEIAFFIAQQLQSNIRQLEGGLNKIITNSIYSNNKITMEFVRHTLRDFSALKKNIITINHIQEKVSKYFKISISKLLSKNRSKSVVYPRQIAMALTKQLTHYSLSEIGMIFNNKNHTTVLHSCRKINKLKKINSKIYQDFLNLINIITTKK